MAVLSKPGKKVVEFNHIECVERIINDVVKQENCSPSYVIEDAFLSYYLPNDSTMKQIIMDSLYSEKESMRDALIQIFRYLSAVDRRCMPNDTMHEFVSFVAVLEGKSRYMYKVSDDERKGFLASLKTFKDFFKEAIDKSLNKENLQLLEEISDKITWENGVLNHDDCKKLFLLLLNNWEHINNNCSTYGLISNLIKFERDWENTLETRNRLLVIMKELFG